MFFFFVHHSFSGLIHDQSHEQVRAKKEKHFCGIFSLTSFLEKGFIKLFGSTTNKEQQKVRISDSDVLTKDYCFSETF